MTINKIIAVEGLDKTGKSTFCTNFERIYNNMEGIKDATLKSYSFPNSSNPIGAEIRNELNSSSINPEIVNSANFLAEMSSYWMNQLFSNYSNIIENNTSNSIVNNKKINTVNYIFDRYFISTLAYQAFYNNSKLDLEFIKYAINNNDFLKLPSDIIFLDLPNDIIIERTISDQESGLNDLNDTIDTKILDKRRESYLSALRFLEPTGVKIHAIPDVSKYSQDDLIKILMGKIF